MRREEMQRQITTATWTCFQHRATEKGPTMANTAFGSFILRFFRSLFLSFAPLLSHSAPVDTESPVATAIRQAVLVT